MLDLVVRACAKRAVYVSSFKIPYIKLVLLPDTMAGVLVNAPPVVQLEQLQPPRGVVAGFSSEAELSHSSKRWSCRSSTAAAAAAATARAAAAVLAPFGADLSSEGRRGSAHRPVIRELHTPGQSSFYLGVLCFSPCPRGEKRAKVWHGTACIDLVCEVKTAKNP